MKKFLPYVLVFGIISTMALIATAADFTITDNPTLDVSQRYVLFSGPLNAGQSLSSRLTQIIQSNPAPGSQAEQVKNLFTRTVPAGKTVRVQMQIFFEVQ